MPKVTIPIVGEAYTMPAKQLDSQSCINWYVVDDATGKFHTALFPTPGLTLFTEIVGAKEVRALFKLNNILYAVIDNKFYSVDGNGNFTDLTSTDQPNLETSTGNVRIIPNDNQLFLTDGSNGYVYQIVDSGVRSAGDFFRIENASSNIGTVSFTGAGTNDMTTDGEFIGSASKQYLVRIDGSPVGGPDTFKWSDNNGVTFNATGVAITGGLQDLNDGIQVKFSVTSGHTINDTWTFETTIDSSFYVPIIPAYQDGYGIYIRQNSNRFYISEINDFSRVNALDFAESNRWPDNLVAAISIREELWLIGRQTAEVWYDVGAAVFPFEPRTNLLIKYGTLAPYSVVAGEDNLLFWLANNEEGGKVIVMVQGYVPQIISSEAVNAAIEGYDKIDDAIGGVYQWDGHLFYWITFPSEDRTWQYDLKTKTWIERRSTLQNESLSSSPTRQGRWRVNNHSYFQSNHYFGDFESGKIYKLDRGNYTENGEYVLRERTTRTVQNSLHRLCLYSLQIDVEKGVGLTEEADQGNDPQIMLQISRDDGATFGSELWRSLGKKGEYSKRVKWTRLGESDSFVFRIRTTDPTFNVIMGAVPELEDTGT